MGVLAVASAKGSPGATTTALLLGALWPRMSVVAECDPSGGDVAWRMPDPDGRPLDPQTGLLSLVAAGRRSLHPGMILQHTQRIVGGLEVLPGVSAPEQAAGMHWEELARVFAGAPGVDVIADLGRIGAQTPQNSVLTVASALVMVVDTLPSNVIHLRERISRLAAGSGRDMVIPTHVVVISPPKRERAVREVREALERARVDVEDVHHVAHDPAGAGFFLGQVRGRADRTALVRSAQPIAMELAERTEPFFVEDPAAPDEDATEPGDEVSAS